MTMTSTVPNTRHNAVARGPRPQRVTAGRVGLYLFLVITALFFLMPVGVMINTSLKSMEEIRQGNIFALPLAPSFDAWIKAWDSACTGLNCTGIKVGFFNSVKILIPSVILSIAIAAWTGYMLSFWRARGATILFAILMIGAFIPFQVFLFPLVRVFSKMGIYNTLDCIVVVHTVFGLPTLSLLFRNVFVSLPIDCSRRRASMAPTSGRSSATSCCRWRCRCWLSR